MLLQCFNLNREASSLATKKIPLFQAFQEVFQSQPRSQLPGDFTSTDEKAIEEKVSISTEKPAPWRRVTLAYWSFTLEVSISTEKPAPWRRTNRLYSVPGDVSFNLNREASSLATSAGVPLPVLYVHVSISTEKPAPWRQNDITWQELANFCFNLNREASSLATAESEFFAPL